MWLIKQLDERGWNQAELHRRSGMSKTIISDVIAGTAKPGWDFCVGIAKAFRLPADYVMGLAGLLPEFDRETVEHKKLIHAFDLLNAKDKQTILDMMSFLLHK